MGVGESRCVGRAGTKGGKTSEATTTTEEEEEEKNNNQHS